MPVALPSLGRVLSWSRGGSAPRGEARSVRSSTGFLALAFAYAIGKAYALRGALLLVFRISVTVKPVKPASLTGHTYIRYVATRHPTSSRLRRIANVTITLFTRGSVESHQSGVCLSLSRSTPRGWPGGRLADLRPATSLLLGPVTSPVSRRSRTALCRAALQQAPADVARPASGMLDASVVTPLPGCGTPRFWHACAWHTAAYDMHL